MGIGRLTLSVDELREAMGSATVAPVEPDEPDMWMTAKDVAAMLQTSTRFAFDHQRELGGKKLSRRCLRFSRRAVERYLARRHA